MPIPLTTLFRLLVIALLGAHVFVMYGMARTMGDGFGFTAGACAIATLFAGAMLVPMVWAVTLPDLPRIYTGVVRARRWWRAGRCPACGYPRGEASECSECGAPAQAPAPYRVTRRTVQQYVIVNLIALLLGCVVAETMIGLDELHFRVEIEQGIANGMLDPGSSITVNEIRRPRRWPSGWLTWSPEEGFGSRGGIGG